MLSFEGFEERDIALPSVRIHARIGGRADAPPLLLMHGFPQSHVMWRRVALEMAPHFRLVLPDLRGYGDSAKPPGESDHGNYSKRTMAADMHTLMAALGHERYGVAGHDRGGRVGHRLALDQPQAVTRLAVLDIAPTLDMWDSADMRLASAYFHWFFLIQPSPRPETLINAHPLYFLNWMLAGWGSGPRSFMEPEALAEYARHIALPQTVHGICEDYRASASIDREHDRESRSQDARVACPMLVLWGTRGVIHSLFDALHLWQAQCSATVEGRAMDCGHYMPEELPQETTAELLQFFRRDAATN